ncbi:MAG TPA: hypothetical protein VFZ27_13585 [Terriglobia bacterium]|nr:hypothetical protein [Terriglobia bacterium]
MDRKLSVLFLVVVIGFPVYLRAQSASGIIAPSRMVNWSSAGVQGGIPDRTTVCATLSPGASASQINSAIASCPSGQVVSLKAGTYNLSSGINFDSHSNVTLRGAGANQTFLIFTGSVSCNGFQADVCIEGDSNWSGGPTNSASWTGGYSQGTTQITLSSTSGLVPGNMLILDQANDSSDTGSVWVCETQGVCTTEGPAGGGRSGRTQEQIVRVEAVSGNTVTISPGLYMPNWRSSQSPGAWWSSTDARSDGIEDLSMDHRLSPQMSGMVFFNAINCWAKGIRSLSGNRNHVWLYQDAHTTIADSYFYGTLNAASQSYGIEVFMASDNLIANNIFQHITAPIMNNGPSSGNVAAYNFSTNDYYAVSLNWMMAATWFHSAGTSMNLFEGNVGAGYTADDIHGTHNFGTAFRNYWTGWEPGKSGQTVPILLYAGSRYFNIIGNVLGNPGYHNNYESVAPDGSNYATSIYGLGWSGNGSTSSGVPNDANVTNTLLRWGNYDVATSSVRWDTSEVPSSISRYSNPVPSSKTLPDSFFLSAKPGWWTTPWGSPPWPAIGPDVSGGPGPGGHAYAIPAELCYDNTSKDLTGVLNFSAQGCYSGSAAPTAPVNLGAVAH